MIRLIVTADKNKANVKLDGGICTHREAMNLARGIGSALASYVTKLPEDEQDGAMNAFLKGLENGFETR